MKLFYLHFISFARFVCLKMSLKELCAKYRSYFREKKNNKHNNKKNGAFYYVFCALEAFLM